MTKYDNELLELERDIKEKKQEISDTELAVKKLEHDLVTVQKEQNAAKSLIESLESQFPWIQDEKRWV